MGDRYAIVENGVIVNAIVWNGEGTLDLEQSGYSKDAFTVEITDSDMAGPGDYYDGKVFTRKPPTEEEKAYVKAAAIKSNLQEKDNLMSEATQRLSVLNDAVDLEMATDEEAAALPLWKKYRVLLSRVNANTSDEVKWPDKPDF